MAADALSRIGSPRKTIPPNIFLEHLRVPSVKGVDPDNPEHVDSPVNTVMAVTSDWMKPYLAYLVDGILPDDQVLRRQIIRRVKATSTQRPYGHGSKRPSATGKPYVA